MILLRCVEWLRMCIGFVAKAKSTQRNILLKNPQGGILLKNGWSSHSRGGKVTSLPHINPSNRPFQVLSPTFVPIAFVKLPPLRELDETTCLAFEYNEDKPHPFCFTGSGACFLGSSVCVTEFSGSEPREAKQSEMTWAGLQAKRPMTSYKSANRHDVVVLRPYVHGLDSSSR